MVVAGEHLDGTISGGMLIRGQSGRGSMLKVMTIVGTRPELIRLSRVIVRLDDTIDHVLVHTGQNYDFELNEIFFRDLAIPQARSSARRRQLVVGPRPGRDTHPHGRGAPRGAAGCCSRAR